jgi:hypothetical protein
VGPRDVPQRAIPARESIGVDQELYVQAVTLACTRAHTYTHLLTRARNTQLQQPKEQGSRSAMFMGRSWFQWWLSW